MAADPAREQAAREFGDVAASRAELAAVDRLRLAREQRAAWWEGVAALLAGRWVAPLLYETSPRDPSVFGIFAAMLLGVTLLATVVPTRRALRVDPITALRSD